MLENNLKCVFTHIIILYLWNKFHESSEALISDINKQLFSVAEATFLHKLHEKMPMSCATAWWDVIVKNIVVFQNVGI